VWLREADRSLLVLECGDRSADDNRDRNRRRRTVQDTTSIMAI